MLADKAKGLIDNAKNVTGGGGTTQEGYTNPLDIEPEQVRNSNRMNDTKWLKTTFLAVDVSSINESTDGFVQSSAFGFVQSSAFGFVQSSAFLKFTDTTPGGNMAINPAPQFGRYSDLTVRGKYSDKSKGMGRYYSEKQDDNAQIVYMRCGVPQFNSLSTYYGNFYNYEASVLSRTGRSPSFMFTLGKIAGYVVTAPIQPLIYANKLLNFLDNKPSIKYYYLKPTMPLYWSSVNTMLNGIAVNMGIVPRVFAGTDGESQAGDQKPANDMDLDETEIEQYDTYDGVVIMGDKIEGITDRERRAFNELLPNVIRENGGIDVYAIASRAQRNADAAADEMEKALERGANRGNIEGFYSEVRKALEDRPNIEADHADFGVDGENKSPFNRYIEAWTNTTWADSSDDNTTTDDAADNKSTFSKMFEFMEAEEKDGGQFARFRVNHVGEMSESFSNSIKESGVSQTLNSTSADARDKRFNFANGSVVGGAVGNMIESTIGAVTDLAAGALSSVGMDGLLAFAGNAYADIPKVWESSTANLPTASYNIELRSPYGHPMSRLLNMYLPLSMILTAALPKSVGKFAYDSPFLVEFYDQGRNIVRLGIIDSLTITRGVGNIGWTKNNEPLGINVDFTVADMSSIMHAPFNASPGLLDEDSKYSDYMATLASMSLPDLIYSERKLHLNLTRFFHEKSTLTWPSRWASTFSGGGNAWYDRMLTRMFRYDVE